MYATPPKFGTTPIEEGDELFELKELVCVDCKQTFQSSRHSLRCAMCASLRRGQVGPATVTCPACEKEHQVPVLSPHRLCPSCASDLDATEAHIRDTLATAEQALTDARERWDADLAHSGEGDWWGRVSAAALAVERGEMSRTDYDRKARAALAQGGPRAALLRQSMVVEELVRATERTRERCVRALEEVEVARHDQ